LIKEVASQYQSGQYDVNANNISKFFDNIEHITAPNYEVKSLQEAPSTDKESNFDTGTHKNTKTGEEQAKATFKDRVSKDSYKVINSVAKHNGGYYSRFAKAFLFNDESSRDAFVKEANALMAINVKASSLNFAERLRSNIELMPDNELPSREQALQAFGKTLGIDTVFFKGNKVLNGFYHNGVSFINTQSKVPNSWIFWHEAFHWMGKNNVSLFNDMVDYLESKEGFSDAQLNEYRDSIGRPEMTNIETIEEMMADYMPDVRRRVSLFQNLGKDNKSLATRFVAWVHDLMDRFTEFMNTPAAGLTNTQKQSMREAFEKLACSMVDENGNRIFKVMRKSREIRLLSGEPLVNEKYSINNSGYDLGAEKLNDDIQKWEKLCDLYDASDKTKWKSKKNGKLFDFMDMPLVLELVGAKNMKLQVYGSFFEHAIRSKHPGMDSAVLKKLPASMADPIIILKTADPKKFIFALTIKDNNGATVIVPVELEKVDPYHGVISVLNTAYGKDTPGMRWFTNKINNGDLVYLNKEKSTSWYSPSGANSPVGTALRSALSSSSIKTEDDLVKEKALNPERYSIAKKDKSFIDAPFKKLLLRFRQTHSSQIQVELAPHNNNKIGSIDKVLSSPSNIAQRVKAFKMFYEYATRGMQKLTKLRSDFNRKYSAAMDLVKDKNDKANLYEIMLQGDTEGKEWTKQELIDEGTKENVAEAYVRVRHIMNMAYRLLNDARRRPQDKSATLDKAQLDDLKKNRFTEVLKATEKDSGKYLVTYKEYANWKKTYAVNGDELKHMKADDAIQILKETNVGDNAYEIEVREGIPDLNKLTGYVPHFFHEFFVMQKGKDGRTAIVDSGRTMKEAVNKAESYLKNNPDAHLSVRPKQFDFAQVGLNQKDDMRYAVTIGDNEYKSVMHRMATENDISMTEAREMMQGKLKLKNRHRFYGNFIQRKGATGYEKDLGWVMRHFFNTSSRYVAMETEFKPKAISLFERLYGRFDDAHSDNATARYIKDYINDINGNPTAVEMWVNDLLNNWKWWRNHVVSNFGDRAALQGANILTNTVSVMKLGCFNISSAMINLSQLVNSAALIGDVNVLWKALEKGAHKKYSISDLKILTESGVLNDIGLDSGAGYGKMSVGNIANKSMFFFKQSEGLVRRGTVLAAYEQAIKRGMNHDKAIEYAQQVNRKANFDYGVNDAPNIFRRGSVFSQVLLQFKKYPIKEFELMAEMVSKDTTPRQKAIFWGSYFLMAGLFQVPALDWFDDLGQYFFGKSYKNKVKQAIFRAAGDDPVMKALAQIAVYGVFSTANVDISSRAGVGDAIPSSTMNLLGPAVSSVIQPLMYAKDGDAMQALKMLSPGIANIIMAVSGKNEGSRGRTNAVYDSAYDRVLRGLGFKSVDESIATDKQSILYDDRKQLQKEKQDAVDDFIDNPSSDNLARIKELGIKPKTVKDERKRKQEDKAGRMKDSMSKKKQKENDDFLSF